MAASPIEKTKPEMVTPLGPWRAFLLPLVAAWIALASIPAIPSAPQARVDPSWMVGLHMAQDLGLVHGRDLVWTYGPIAWLGLPVTPAEHLVPVLVFRYAMWGIWVAALLRLILLVASKAIPLIVFATVGALAVSHDLLSGMLPDSHLDLAIVSVALLPLAIRSQWVYLELGALAFLTGLATMVKFNLAMEAAGIFGCLLVTVFVRERTARKRSLWKTVAVGMVFPLTAIGLYWASTGHIGTIGPYLRNTIEISAGYSEGMSVEAPSFFVNAALLTIVALLVGVPALAYRRRSLIAGWGPAAIAAFFAFKHGTVRGDVHLLPMQANLALAACFMLVGAAQHDRKLVATIQIIALLLGFYAVLIVVPEGGSNIRDRLSLTTSIRVAGALLNLDSTRDSLKSQTQKNLVSLRASQAVQDKIADGTVEVVPYNTTQVFANGWRWAPRPVFQTYVAFTPAHDLLNAEHLRNHRAADFVLVHAESIDQRHPFAEDPLSWRALLEGYEVVWQNDETLLFAKRSEPHRFSLVEIASTSVGWDRKIPVPAYNGPLVVKLISKRSLVGQLSNLFFRVNPVHVEVTYESGEKRSWRVVRPNLVHGFVVQPFPTDLSEIAQFANTGDVPESRVASVRLIPTTPSQFHPEILARWFHLKSGQGSGPSWAAAQTPATSATAEVANASSETPALRTFAELHGQPLD